MLKRTAGRRLRSTATVMTRDPPLLSFKSAVSYLVDTVTYPGKAHRVSTCTRKTRTIVCCLFKTQDVGKTYLGPPLGHFHNDVH